MRSTYVAFELTGHLYGVRHLSCSTRYWQHQVLAASGTGPVKREQAVSSSPVTIYWRPMCGYCEVLKRELTVLGVAFDEIDIWEQREYSDVVRKATGGDEIVPTVRVGEQFLVNPSAKQVLAALGGVN